MAVVQAHGPRSLQEWCKWASNRTKRNQHVVFGITGEPGKGKSSLGVLLARRLDERFSPNSQTVFGEKAACNLGTKIGKNRVIHCDEGGEGGNKRRFMSGANVDTADHLDKCRKLNQYYIFTRPFFADYDTAVQAHLMWVFNVNKLGEFIAYEVQTHGIKKKGVFLSKRFTGSFPDAAKVQPELWAEYNELVHAMLQTGGGDQAFRLEVERVQGLVRLIANRAR